VSSARGQFGWRLSDLVAHSKLGKSTAHRILKFLERERLVQRRRDALSYGPGPLLFELGLALPAYPKFAAACQPSVDRLARRTGAVAYVFLRSGTEFVCIARGGTATIRALSIDVGARRPLVMAAGGLAMLAALGRDECAQIVRANVEDWDRWSEKRVMAVEKVVRKSRAAGYGLVQGDLIPGVAGIGTAILDAGGVPFASVSVAGATEVLPPARTAAVLAILGDSAKQIAAHAQELLGAK